MEESSEFNSTLNLQKIQLVDSLESTFAKCSKANNQNHLKIGTDAGKMYPNYLIYFPDPTYCANTNTLG